MNKFIILSMGLITLLVGCSLDDNAATVTPQPELSPDGSNESTTHFREG